MSHKPCYHKGTAPTCDSEDACTWAVHYWRKRAVRAEGRIRRMMRHKETYR